MEKNVISEQVLKDLVDVFVKQFKVQIAYQSPKVTLIKDCGDRISMEWLQVMHRKFGAELQGHVILLEYPDMPHNRKFVCFGMCRVNLLLAREFGGQVSDNCYWVLYDEPQSCSHYGYCGEEQPQATDIVRFIEEAMD